MSLSKTPTAGLDRSNRSACVYERVGPRVLPCRMLRARSPRCAACVAVRIRACECERKSTCSHHAGLTSHTFTSFTTKEREALEKRSDVTRMTKTTNGRIDATERITVNYRSA